MKVEYAGNSVLFTDDALGRLRNNPACIATEKFLVENVGDALQSTIMFSPHHGAENGSSKKFLDKVKPQHIIIPAGHFDKFKQSRKATCLRYLNYVTADHIFLTDRGDDREALEWDYHRLTGCVDKATDADIKIDLKNKLTICNSPN